MKIAILLPYKENFSPEYPGAVSLFVYETSKISKFKKNIIVFGNTNFKKKFPIKYVKNFYFYQIDRWDLQLLNDKTIKFPHKNVETAIVKSIELLNRKDFENYNIIDLRIEGKIIVE